MAVPLYRQRVTLSNTLGLGGRQMWSGNALHFTSLPHPTCFWEILIPLGALLPTCPHPSPWPWSQQRWGGSPVSQHTVKRRQAGRAWGHSISWGPCACSRRGSLGEPQGMGCLVGQWVVLLSQGWGSVVALSIPGSRVQLKVLERGGS